MSTLPPMLLPSLRKCAVISAAVSLICFDSCERHEAHEHGEHKEHVQSKAAEHEGHHDKAKAEKGDQQHRSTTALTPTPSATAAQFFPENSPH